MTAGVITPARSFYDGTGDRHLSTCPDCRLPQDAAFPHDGCCLVEYAPRERLTAREVIRRYALDHEWLSANELRPLMKAQGITAYSAALTAAVRAGWLRPGGHVPSTDPATKAHHIQSYESKLYPTERKTA